MKPSSKAWIVAAYLLVVGADLILTTIGLRRGYTDVTLPFLNMLSYPLQVVVIVTSFAAIWLFMMYYVTNLQFRTTFFKKYYHYLILASIGLHIVAIMHNVEVLL